MNKDFVKRIYVESSDFSENKIDHMVNGSKGSNHNWEKLVPDKKLERYKKYC